MVASSGRELSKRRCTSTSGELNYIPIGSSTQRPKCCCPVARLILKTDEPSMSNRNTSEWPRCSRFVALAVLILTTCVSASDWPTYRRDARRNALSEDQLEFPLRVAWQRQSKLPPRPAFEDPFKHPTDVDFACIRDHSESCFRIERIRRIHSTPKPGSCTYRVR